MPTGEHGSRRPSFVDFRNNRSNGTDHPETDGTSFTFLDFTHVWGRSRAGNKVVRQVTAKKTGTRERWRRCRLGACSTGISPSLTSTPI